MFDIYRCTGSQIIKMFISLALSEIGLFFHDLTTL